MTYDEFNALVLAIIHAPVTRNNLDKLAAINAKENTKAQYNPMAWNRPDSGSSNFNSVGVQNYASLMSGLLQTANGLSQSNTKDMRANLQNNGPYSDFINATQRFYTWAPGITFGDEPSAQAFGSNQLPWQPAQSEIDLAQNQITADPGAAAELVPFIGGTVTSSGQTRSIIGSITHLPGDVASGTANAIESLPGVSTVLDAVKEIWKSVTNVQNWINVLKVIGGSLLVLVGLYILAMSFNVAPTPAEMARKSFK